MLTKAEIIAKLEKIGLKTGDKVMVHSSLSSLGWVDGGAETVIDALLEVIGETGTLLMPALTSGSKENPYEGIQTPSYLGQITEAFRRRPEVKRSFHPTHSVLALGKDAEALIADHIKAESACGLGTPYYKLAEVGGSVLLLGVDLDRCTILHTAEDLADCPFLTERTFYYRDPQGNIQKKELRKFPGPHRDFIGLDQQFRQAGIIKLGLVGGAVTRLIKAQALLLEATKILNENPAAVLCDNPSCRDCLKQKGQIRSSMLRSEQFKLSAILSDFQPQADTLDSLNYYAVNKIELSDYLTTKILINGDLYLENFKKKVAEKKLNVVGIGHTTSLDSLITDGTPTSRFEKLKALAYNLEAKWIRLRIRHNQNGEIDELSFLQAIRKLARELNNSGISMFLVNDPRGPLATPKQIESLFLRLKEEKIENVKFAFDPAGFVETGKKPFLDVFYSSKLAKVVQNLVLTDSRFQDGSLTLLAKGNGEIKELISSLRCRSYNGYLTIGSLTDRDPFSLEERLCDFWEFFSSL